MKSVNIVILILALQVVAQSTSHANSLNIVCDETLAKDLEEGNLITPDNCENRINLIRGSVTTDDKGRPSLSGMTLAASIELFGEAAISSEISPASSRVRELKSTFSKFESAKRGSFTEASSFEYFDKGINQLLADMTKAINTAIENESLSEGSTIEMRGQLRKISRWFRRLSREISNDYPKLQSENKVVTETVSKSVHEMLGHLDKISNEISNKTGIDISKPATEESRSSRNTPESNTKVAITKSEGRFPRVAAGTANLALILFQIAFEYVENHPSTQFENYVENLPAPQNEKSFRMAVASNLPVSLILNEKLSPADICRPLKENNQLWIEQVSRVLSGRLKCIEDQTQLIRTQLREGRPLI